jgi:DGQHR domain-containing protein
LGVPYDAFGARAITSNPSGKEPFPGSVLPEAHSKFPDGYKVVSFYMHPGALLARAFVLRRDGWRDRGGVYQRMIIRKKIEDIRRHLIEKERVFVNNIIVTLPSNTKLLDKEDNTVDPKIIQKTSPVVVSIPDEFNSIGIIDGQHRIFSYFEGGFNEDKIAALRLQQNLLVTGIVYPAHATPEERTRFEAALFLEINSTQANAKSDLKQAINQIVKPFIADSIARDTLDALNRAGPLEGIFEQHFFETDKVKTTSIVSYGLRPLVRPTAGAPLFDRWTDNKKSTFIPDEDDAARKRYVKFCAEQVSTFIGAAKSQLPSEKWTADRQITDRLLTPTIINGLIGALRLGIEHGLDIDFVELRDRFKDLSKFEFGKYRSSQYTVMSKHIFEKFLK